MLWEEELKQRHALLPCRFKQLTPRVAPLLVIEMIPLGLSHSSHLRLNTWQLVVSSPVFRLRFS